MQIREMVVRGSLRSGLVPRALRAFSAGLRGLGWSLSSSADQIDAFRGRHVFVPRDGDVFIVTYPRSGTTLVQMLVYQLLTSGEMDFMHISERCPYFERAWIQDRDLDAMATPRVFKSHLPFPLIPKGPCRYVYVSRDVRDVLVSYYHLYKDYLGYQGTPSDFFDRFVAGDVRYGSWFDHVDRWWQERGNPDVLLLTYESIVGDLPSAVDCVASFLGLAISPERRARAIERCSLAFMKQHESRFDFHTEMLLERGARRGSFIRVGQPGRWTEHLTRAQAQQLEVVAARLQTRGSQRSTHG
jgi:hypothetical protein